MTIKPNDPLSAAGVADAADVGTSPAERRWRPSLSYQLGPHATPRDRVLAWCDRNRAMLEHLSPEDIVLSWLEHESRQPAQPVRTHEAPAHD